MRNYKRVYLIINKSNIYNECSYTEMTDTNDNKLNLGAVWTIPKDAIMKGL